jgi:hypothetical protein
MAWSLLIQALQALLTVAIQEVGRRHKSSQDVIEQHVIEQLPDHQRAALCELGEMCKQPGQSHG